LGPASAQLRVLRTLLSLAGVALVTYAGAVLFPVNATTIGFAYLLLVLLVATFSGFIDALLASIAATLTFNYFFLPPVGRFTIADPQNWIALVSFLASALIASRLSDVAKRRTADVLARQRDVERMYTFSRAILLIDPSEPFAKQLARKVAEVFEFDSVLLYDRRTDHIYRAGPVDFNGMDEKLKDAALAGTSFDDSDGRVVTAIRLGSEPIAALALQGPRMPDAVLQGIGNLIAIGLERARAEDLASQVEAARLSERLRASLIDAMAHEFKTPLTSVMAATSSLLANPDQPRESRMELVEIADQEARHLKDLIEDALEVARLDSSSIELDVEHADVAEIAHEVAKSLQPQPDGRTIEICCPPNPPLIAVDRRLVRMAIKQLVDNALKYSPPTKPVRIDIHNGGNQVVVSVTDYGPGIPPQEQKKIFERLYRSPSIRRQIPGSGLGLSIAQNIARAHHGDLTVTSHPGETTFTLLLPLEEKAAR
jgi:two-component system sensor histidine kinase KdpD